MPRIETKKPDFNVELGARQLSLDELKSDAVHTLEFRPETLESYMYN